MSFMADYGDEDDYSWSREAKQRWTFVVAVMLVAVAIKVIF